MSFMPSSQRVVPGSGNPSAKICIIGEAPGQMEDQQLKPFVGPAGSVLETCLHAAGLTKADCYLTNVVKVRPKGNDIAPFFNEKSGVFTAAGQEWVNQLAVELKGIKANVLVPMGKCALAAVTGKRSITTLRGYVMESTPQMGNRKCIPAYHPAASLRGQYILRYYITADLQKARAECTFPEIKRPERKILVPTLLSECLEWIAYLNKCDSLACDIEVVNFEVSCIGFAPTPDLAVVIPMYHEHWDELEEMQIWRAIAMLLENTLVRKIFQNGIFDVHFLATRCGIHVKGQIDDTMIAHHIQYPEMLKGLGFLVSMYCGAQAHYKDMVKFDNIKKES